MKKSSSKTILIIGGNGFVGSNLALHLRDYYKVYATFHRYPLFIKGVTYLPFDTLERDWVKRVIYTIQPDILLYVAGKNNIEWAEADPKAADLIHVDGIVQAATAANIFNPKLVYISNSHVFDGKTGNYKPKDSTLPVAVLGRAKLNGENYVRTRSLNHLILRSAPLYGRSNFHHPSLFDQLRIQLDHGQKVELTGTEYHNFAPIHEFTEFVRRAIDSGLKGQALHFGGLTRASYLEFGRAVAKQFGYDPNLLIEKKPPEIRGIRLAPTYDYSLNFTDSINLLKIKPFLLEEGLDLFEKHLIARAS